MSTQGYIWTAIVIFDVVAWGWLIYGIHELWGCCGGHLFG